MANPAHLDVLKQGSMAWNTWREQHPLCLDLSGANLGDISLRSANLIRNMKLSQFMQFIRETWALTPRQAMDLLNLKSLNGLNYRDLLRHLQPLVEQQAHNAPTSHQTLEEQDNENEQTMAIARLKLGELKEMRGASAAHPERLAVLQTVLNAQIDDHQLQRLIQAAWGATTVQQLKVNQVEALISWPKKMISSRKWMACWISSTRRSRRRAVTGEAKGHKLKAAKTTATPSHSRPGEDGSTQLPSEFRK